jgi:branched-chain amino acid transport system ATP-binding protein
VRGFQTVRLLERETLLTNVLLGTEGLPHARVLSQLVPIPVHVRDRRRDVAAAMEVLELLHLAANADRRVVELPFAERRLVEVARVLVSRPDVILLDEPAAGLDARGRDDLARVLTEVHQHSTSTMIVVEHDVDLVTRLCSHVVVLASGSYLTSGTPEQVFADPVVRLAYFGSDFDA